MNKTGFVFDIILSMVIVAAMLLARSITARIVLMALFLIAQIVGISRIAKLSYWNAKSWYLFALKVLCLGFLLVYTITTPILLGMVLLVALLVGLFMAIFKKEPHKIVVYQSKAGKDLEKVKIEKEIESLKNEIQNNDHTFMAKMNGKKYHKSNCMVLAKAEKEQLVSFSSKQDAEGQGYRPCKICIQ